MARRVAADQSQPIDQLIKSLGQEELAEVVLRAVEQHDDVEAAVRLVAARSSEDSAVLRSEVDRTFRTRRFLGGLVAGVVREGQRAMAAGHLNRGCFYVRAVTSGRSLASLAYPG